MNERERERLRRLCLQLLPWLETVGQMAADHESGLMREAAVELLGPLAAYVGALDQISRQPSEV